MSIECTSCDFWEVQSELRFGDKRVGQCRRHAPTLKERADGQLRSAWPFTAETEFCGDHSRGVVG